MITSAIGSMLFTLYDTLKGIASRFSSGINRMVNYCIDYVN